MRQLQRQHIVATMRRRQRGQWLMAAVCACGWHSRPHGTYKDAHHAGRVHRRASEVADNLQTTVTANKSGGAALAGDPSVPTKTFRGGPGGEHQRKH